MPISRPPSLFAIDLHSGSVNVAGWISASSTNDFVFLKFKENEKSAAVIKFSSGALVYFSINCHLLGITLMWIEVFPAFQCILLIS